MSVGLLVYNVNELAENDIFPGVYYWSGEKWEISKNSSKNNPEIIDNSGAIKINVNQSKSITLSGTQSYGLLMQNQGATINPQYVAGFYPGGGTSGIPISVITSTDGNNGNNEAFLMEAPIVGKVNFFMINMQYVMGNKPPIETRSFDVKIESVVSGSIVYQSYIIVPGKINTGQISCFQVSFSTISDVRTLASGYRIIFGTDSSASQDLSNNIDIKIVDITRVN